MKIFTGIEIIIIFTREPNCIFEIYIKMLCIETSTSLNSLQKFEASTGSLRYRYRSHKARMGPPVIRELIEIIKGLEIKCLLSRESNCIFSKGTQTCCIQKPVNQICHRDQIFFFIREPNCILKSYIKVLHIETRASLSSSQKFEGVTEEFNISIWYCIECQYLFLSTPFKDKT